MSSAVNNTHPTLTGTETAPTGTTHTTQEQAPNVVHVPQDSAQPPVVPFKEQVIGVAKKTRGTLLGKPELKEHGEQILRGESGIHDEPPSHTLDTTN
ncbi:hypothetical protein B0H15DRAFT_953849 [Mycena belliarum]|uniref:Uncharacterized protein n=1 Tax=Mycena belliarum TaxID=1033014 RepID=A0AAD6TXI0_9AGAR|nr:hypothetical protein B0H15DRAFT_953849 [Mycena belliae]